MPEGWAWTKIHCVSSEILYGVSESAKETGKYKLLRITDIQDDQVNWDSVPFTDFPEDKVSNYILKNGDIVFARTGATVGKSYLIENLKIESIYASYLIRIRTSLLLNPRYMKYYFGSLTYWNQITDKSSGIGQPNVNGTSLANLYIPIPPYNEQKRILPVIEKVFKLIDSLENDKDKLENLIKAAKSKILDLAIHGKLVPQDPNDEPAEELLKRIATSDNRPYEKVDEEPFEIPDSWCWCNLGMIGTWKAGCTPNKKNLDYYKNGTIPWMLTGDLNDNFITNIPNKITDLAYKQTSLKLNPANSVCIAMYGATIGKLGILSFPSTTNQACCVCSDYQGIFYKYLFYFLMQHKNEFIQQGFGGAQPNISKEKIISTLIPLPPLNEQNRIVYKIEELYTVLDQIQNNLV